MGISSDSIRLVGEADLLELGRVARSTWQNWVRAEVVDAAEDGLYDEDAVVELIIVAMLLGALDVRQVKHAWRPARQPVVAQAIALPLDGVSPLLAIIDLHTWRLSTATGGEMLWAAIQETVPYPRGRIVFDVAASVVEGRRAFWARAVPAADLLKDKRRKRRSAVSTTRRTRGAS